MVTPTTRRPFKQPSTPPGRTGSYNRSTESHDWKRRAERLVRPSGLPYTIVRPGWFDYNKADEHQLVFLQGEEAVGNHRFEITGVKLRAGLLNH